jgi:deoxyribodipyrimidine photo-lyase
MINIKRVKTIKKNDLVKGAVLYWMSRDQRVNDNWALTYAVEMAENNSQPVMVVFNMVTPFLDASWRQYDFMIKGLKKIEGNLKQLNIPFNVLLGDPGTTIPNFVQANHIAHLVMDFDPLRIKRKWQEEVIQKLNISIDLVDAHNIVPCFVASEKAEYAAATFRPKIRKLLHEFLDEFPPLVTQRSHAPAKRINWEAWTISLNMSNEIKPVEWISPGEQGALNVLEKFMHERLHKYAAERNDPNAGAVSGLSPYLHFGHISAQRVALKIIADFKNDANTSAFLEELIVRKELADNFCYYNTNYDQVSCFLPWARNSLQEHLGDERDFIYSPEEFETSRTHDDLWNAAQMQIVNNGSLHGYLRMYWAKKILEWTQTPEDALRIAIYLNDKYMLDGRDPNGYTGCAWSIGGIHDRAWNSRKIFGKIRYMNRAGCERKFDVNRYIQSVNQVKKLY